MATLLQDTFTRANVVGGWGIASDGNTWTTQTGTATLALTSDEGIIQDSTASMWRSLGAALTEADTESLVRLALGSSGDAAGVVARMTAGRTAYYMFRLTATTIDLYKLTGGTTTNIQSAAYAPTIGDFYWLRFRVQGNNLYGRIWLDGSGEPSTWNLTVSDSSVAAAGLGGLYGYGTATPGLKFDSLTVTTIPTTDVNSGFLGFV